MQCAAIQRQVADSTSISTTTEVTVPKPFLQRNSEAFTARGLTGKSQGRLAYGTVVWAEMWWGMGVGIECFQHLEECSCPWPEEERGHMMCVWGKKTFAVLGYSKQSVSKVIFSTRLIQHLSFTLLYRHRQSSLIPGLCSWKYTCL